MCHPERSKGSKVLAGRGLVLAGATLIPTFVRRHFRFLTPLRSFRNAMRRELRRVRNDTRRGLYSPSVENQKTLAVIESRVDTLSTMARDMGRRTDPGSIPAFSAANIPAASQ